MEKNDKKRIGAIIEFINTSERSLQNAKKILKELIGEHGIKLDKPNFSTDGLISYTSGKDKIIEGIFTGEEMFGTDSIKYTIPANYASKSKLVQGDRLKLTIKADGRMLYKQIKQIPRTIKIGLLAENNGNYQVIVEGKSYNLLKAAVTHFGGKIGNKLAVIIPTSKTATFAAIENVIYDELEEEEEY